MRFIVCVVNCIKPGLPFVNPLSRKYLKMVFRLILNNYFCIILHFIEVKKIIIVWNLSVLFNLIGV